MSRLWLPLGLSPRREEDPNAPRYADIYERAMAAALDLVLLYLLFNPLFQWMSRSLYRNIDHAKLRESQEAATAVEAWELAVSAHVPQIWALNSLLQLMLIGMLLVAVQSKYRTTPGKWVMGLKVVLYPDLSEPREYHYIVRYVGYMLSALPVMLGFIWISFTRERRGWHDRLAGTAVIHIRPQGWYWEQVKRGCRWVKAKLA